MKKLLILMLVLTIATYVSAGTITVTSNDLDNIFALGQVVEITLIASGFNEGNFGAGELGQFFADAVTDSGTGDAATGLAHALFDFSAIATDGSSAGGDILTNLAFTANATDGDYDVPNGASAYTFDYTAAGDSGTISLDGLVTKDLFAGSNTTSLVSLNYTPEPTTIALLGLGALFLRRRKA